MLTLVVRNSGDKPYIQPGVVMVPRGGTCVRLEEPSFFGHSRVDIFEWTDDTPRTRCQNLVFNRAWRLAGGAALPRTLLGDVFVAHLTANDARTLLDFMTIEWNALWSSTEG